MIAGVGIDLVEIGRVERALARRPRLAERLFTAAERDYAAGQARPGRHLAARFAAKEAVIKALALRDGAPMHEIEVISGAPPSIRLLGRAERLAAGRRLSLSLSHTDSHATAVVVAEAAP